MASIIKVDDQIVLFGGNSGGPRNDWKILKIKPSFEMGY